MDNKISLLKEQLSKCHKLLNKGYISVQISDIKWLNNFCAEFLHFANELHKFIAHDIDKRILDNIFLCLTQIVCCIRQLERTIKAEEASGAAISSARQHFLDRINFCIERLSETLCTINAKQHILDDQTIVQLMDEALDYLTQFSAYSGDKTNSKNSNINVAEENAEIMFTSKQIRSVVDLILGHTLSFANVALKQDKKALSALCQKVLRECSALQQECELNRSDFNLNDSNRKLKAMSLEHALYQLEDSINEALLRLVYTCFLDFEKFSIEQLRHVIRNATCVDDDVKVDECIADFDVHIDRCMQIGIFAIAFAPNMKMKTIVRSCLASLESLDTCLVPSLQTCAVRDLHSELLEQHFNEEIESFKCSLQEIIDSHAFVGCYLEMLTDSIGGGLIKNEKIQKTLLLEMLQMGQFLRQHFQLSVNQKILHSPEHPERQKYFQQYNLMLDECQAIINCADQVEPQRVIKRFKILRNIVRKLHEALNDSKNKEQKINRKDSVFIMSDDEFNESQRTLDTAGISCSSMCSILYNNKYRETATTNCRKRAASASLRVNYSKLPNTLDATNENSKAFAAPQTAKKIRLCSQDDLKPLQSGNLRRKESLRTTMFKRQNIAESERIYKNFQNQSENVHISDILDQLTDLSSSFSSSTYSIDLVDFI